MNFVRNLTENAHATRFRTSSSSRQDRNTRGACGTAIVPQVPAPGELGLAIAPKGHTIPSSVKNYLFRALSSEKADDE